MTTWSPKNKPTKANIRKRIEAAQAAVNGAMDLIKQTEKHSKRNGPLVPLNNAHAWLVDANRKLDK